jgi:hypothetical protein
MGMSVSTDRRREARIEISTRHTMYQLLSAASAQMEPEDFIAEVSSYLFEQEHSDAIMEHWRKYYSDNGLPFPPRTKDQVSASTAVQGLSHIKGETLHDV